MPPFFSFRPTCRRSVCLIFVPSYFYAHALRRVFATTLTNDPHIGIQAALENMHQTSVSAFRMYQVVGKKSEAAKFEALGIENN